MTLPEVATCEQWLEARKRLLTAEITETRRRDALSAERRRSHFHRSTPAPSLRSPTSRLGIRSRAIQRRAGIGPASQPTGRCG